MAETDSKPTVADDAPLETNGGMRTVVALNNMAITLLERNCYKGAMTTLKDGLATMGSLCASDETRRRQRLTLVEQGNFVDKASKRVAQSKPFVTPKVATSSFHLSILSQISNSDEVSKAIRHLPSKSVGYAFRIEFDDSDTGGNLTSSVMLLNLSVACRRHAKMTKKGEKRNCLRRRAYQCAGVANTLLSRELDALEDDAKFERALVLSIFVLHELIQLGPPLGLADESKKHLLELCDRQHIWKETEVAYLPLNRHPTSASAA